MAFGESWGRIPQVKQEIHYLEWSGDKYNFSQNSSVLPYGLGRSYGDVCLNDGGAILVTSQLKNLIAWDPQRGILRCEAGVTIGEILNWSIPRGWFVPVSPGTQFVTIGGAIANDIHGKNHHRVGTFGRHILQFELLRSSGERIVCSPSQNVELFQATIAGLGLTGIILWAEIQLRSVSGSLVDCESIKFRNLEQFFDLSNSSADNFEHTVAWIDCLASGSQFGRGIFMRGNHSADTGKVAKDTSRLSVPIDLPKWCLNRYLMRCFNACYFGKQRAPVVQRSMHYSSFFHPLDAIRNWNRIYGKRGFYQFQCVVPRTDLDAPLKSILKYISESGQGSFLAVLKEFGALQSPGLLSFPRAGMTLALDIPNRGSASIELLKKLDRMVVDFGGAIYPAKDATMSGESFRQYFPNWDKLERLRDPKISSSFWRRVTE